MMRKLCSECFTRHASNRKELYTVMYPVVFLFVFYRIIIFVMKYLSEGDFWHKLKKVETSPRIGRNLILNRSFQISVALQKINSTPVCMLCCFNLYLEKNSFSVMYILSTGTSGQNCINWSSLAKRALHFILQK